MADELEKTCENCKYEYEDIEGTHCRHCIHNAEEHFEPKIIVPTEAEIRNQAIDEFAEKVIKRLENEIAETEKICIDYDERFITIETLNTAIEIVKRECYEINNTKCN